MRSLSEASNQLLASPPIQTSRWVAATRPSCVAGAGAQDQVALGRARFQLAQQQAAGVGDAAAGLAEALDLAAVLVRIEAAHQAAPVRGGLAHEKVHATCTPATGLPDGSSTTAWNFRRPCSSASRPA
jgi:hypothetical protein